MQFYERLRYNHAAEEFYTDIRVQSKYVLCVTECSASTTVTSEHKIILVLDGNVGIKPTSSTSELVSSGILLSVPASYATGYLLYDNVIFRKPFCRRWPVPVKQKVGFQHDGAPAHHGEVRHRLNALYSGKVD
jgi:hypothetical protein